MLVFLLEVQAWFFPIQSQKNFNVSFFLLKLMFNLDAKKFNDCKILIHNLNFYKNLSIDVLSFFEIERLRYDFFDTI